MTASELSLVRAQRWIALAFALWLGWNLRWAVDGGPILKWPWAFLFALVDAAMFVESIRLTRRARKQSLVESRALRMKVDELVQRMRRGEDPQAAVLAELFTKHFFRDL
jgi:hypothetical protein